MKRGIDFQPVTLYCRTIFIHNMQYYCRQNAYASFASLNESLKHFMKILHGQLAAVQLRDKSRRV
jgi:hypothetical protein